MIDRSDLTSLAVVHGNDEDDYFRSTMSANEQQQRGIPQPEVKTVEASTSMTSLQNEEKDHEIEKSAWSLSDLRRVRRFKVRDTRV